MSYFPNIFSNSLPPNPYQKNPNAELPHPAQFDQSLLVMEDDLHVPNQLPANAFPSMLPQFDFNLELTRHDGDYWGGTNKFIKIGHANYWNDGNSMPSKEDQEQNIRSERWNRENEEMEKTLPPIDQNFSSELEKFVKSHTNSKIVPD